MTFESILADLKRKIYHPVYLLYGEEPYFIDELSDYIEDHVLGESEKEFNQTVLYGRDVDAPAIISYARRFPMMANYQVLIIKEAQDAGDLDALTPYLQQPLTSTLLVLCYKYGKIDKRKSIAKAADKAGILFESARLYDNKIPGWIEAYVNERNYTISAKACFMLTEFLGADLSKIVNEIRKLIINIPEGTEIDAELVERNIGISKDFNVFELQKALAAKQVFKANQIIHYFGANPRENPMVKVVPILSSFFAKVLLYQHLQDKSRNHAASALGVHPFFLQDYQATARNYSPANVKSVIGILREYDLKSKGVDNNSATDGELMKEMIFRILH
ncbi:MAG: DNA polymerase III subunit delta [Bacteroidetes bacterium]|nr:MAG: DNA polymerase III subunit delta [Bacteroidota bacterium]